MEKDVVRKFGRHVRNLRMDLKLTQEELAVKSKISLKYVQRIEGKNPPNLSLEKLSDLARGFEIPVWKLLKF